MDVVAAAIGCGEEAAAIRHIRVAQALPMAEITYCESGTVERFFAAGLWAQAGFEPEAAGQTYVGPIGHIGGGALAQLALDYAGPVKSGWVEEAAGDAA